MERKAIMERTTVARLLEHKGSAVVTITPADSVYEALQLMADKEIGALVVVDGERPIGLMSERDHVVLLQRASGAATVGQIMTTDMITVTRGQTTAECMELMTVNRRRHLPVVEEDVLVGVISIGDVLRAVMEEQKFMIEQLEAYIWS